MTVSWHAPQRGAIAAEEAGHMVTGPVPNIRRYTGPDASECAVCGRPGCAPDNPMFRECVQTQGLER